jgi:hypothetical protein
VLHGFLCGAMQGRKTRARKQENAEKRVEEEKKNKR